MAGIRRPRSISAPRAARRSGMPFLSMLTEACADARIPVPEPERAGASLWDGAAVESTQVRPAGDFESLASVVPHEESEEEEMVRLLPRPELLGAAARAGRARHDPVQAEAVRTEPVRTEPVRTEAARTEAVRAEPVRPPLPRRRRSGDGDGSAPRRQAAYTPPIDERTEWDPSPPGAMVARARPPRGGRPPAEDLELYLDDQLSVGRPARQNGPEGGARRAEAIFNRALLAYKRGALHEARTDAILARVYDPDNELYAYAEQAWTAELLRVQGTADLLCSAPSTTGQHLTVSSASKTARRSLPTPSLL